MRVWRTRVGGTNGFASSCASAAPGPQNRAQIMGRVPVDDEMKQVVHAVGPGNKAAAHDKARFPSVVMSSAMGWHRMPCPGCHLHLRCFRLDARCHGRTYKPALLMQLLLKTLFVCQALETKVRTQVGTHRWRGSASLGDPLYSEC